MVVSYPGASAANLGFQAGEYLVSYLLAVVALDGASLWFEHPSVGRLSSDCEVLSLEEFGSVTPFCNVYHH